MDKSALKHNLLSPKHWLRLAFMLLFAGLIQIAVLVAWVVIALQFIFRHRHRSG